MPRKLSADEVAAERAAILRETAVEEPTPASPPEPDDPRVASGRAKHHFAGIDPLKVEAERLKLQAALYQKEIDEGIPEDEAHRRAQAGLEAAAPRAIGPRTKNAEDVADALEAYEGPDTAAKAASRVFRRVIPIPIGGETPLARDETWRQRAQEFSEVPWSEALSDIVAGEAAPPQTEEDIKRQGLDYGWVHKLKSAATEDISGRLLAPLAPIDSLVHAFGGDIPGVSTVGELVEGGERFVEALGEYGADTRVQAITKPGEVAEFGTRIVVASGAGEIMNAALEKAGIRSPSAATEIRGFIDNATTYADFDAAARASYEDGDTTGLDALPFAKLPANARDIHRKEINVALFRAAATTGVLAAAPEAAELRAAIESGADDRFVQAVIERLSLASIRAVASKAAPSQAQSHGRWRTRQDVRGLTAGETPERLIQMVGAAMLTPVETEGGQTLYIPSRLQTVMGLAGAAPELFYEADIPLVPQGEWGDGYKAVRVLKAIRLPTKAGWESVVASGEFDAPLHAIGYAGSKAPLLRYDAHGKPVAGSYLGRWLANLAMPDYQGPGISDALRRQGEAEGSTLQKAATSADVFIDFLFPAEELLLGPVGGAITTTARFGSGGKAAYRAGLRGWTPTRVAWAAAAPSMAGRADGLSAMDAALRAGIIDAVKRGETLFTDLDDAGNPVKGGRKGTMDTKAQREVEIQLRKAGIDPKEAIAKLNDITDERRRLVLDAVSDMLRRKGGPRDEALRQSPAYKAVRQAYEDAGADPAMPGVTPQDATATMALLERLAWKAARDGKVASPEDFFAGHSVVQGGTPAVGAYTQTADALDGGVAPQFLRQPEAPAYRAANQTETPEFARWFGASKVVDTEGKPRVLYHGTTREFDSFSRTQPMNRHPTTNRMSEVGYFFTDRADIAEGYADARFNPEVRTKIAQGSQILPVYMSMSNPKEYSLTEFYREAQSKGGGLRDELMAQGFDGIIARGTYNTNEFVAFSPEQIKSATANRGTFDPRDPSILRSPEGPPAEPPTPVEVLDFPRATERHALDAGPWPEQTGPIHWSMSLEEVEHILAGEAEEHLVIFASDGRQISRSGPTETLALAPGLDPTRACAIYPESIIAMQQDGGSVATHIHPSGRPLSMEDMILAMRANVMELRAVANGDGFTWVVRRPDAGWRVDTYAMRDMMSDVQLRAAEDARVMMNKAVDAAGGNPSDGIRARGYDLKTHTRFYNAAFERHWQNIVTARHDIRLERSPHRDPVRLGADVRGAGGVAGRGPAAHGPAAFPGGHPVVREPTAPEYRPIAPPFYSALRRAIEGMKQERFTADQLRGALGRWEVRERVTQPDGTVRDGKTIATYSLDKKAEAEAHAARSGGSAGFSGSAGVKADEIEWTRLDTFLAENPRPTKAEVLGWLDENAVVVEERVLGGKATLDQPLSPEEELRWRDLRRTEADRYLTDGEGDELERLDELRASGWKTPPMTQYTDYQLPGGTNYREVLFRLPLEIPARSERMLPSGWYIEGENPVKLMDSFGDLRGYGESPAEAFDDAFRRGAVDLTAPEPEATYAAPHFGKEGENLLAHARISDRLGPSGEKILFVEEIQSDAGQGYRDAKTAIGKAVQSDFDGIVDRMKRSGVLEVVCDH